MGTIMAAKWTS